MPTLSISGSISFPLAGEADAPSRDFAAKLVYTQRNVDDVVIVGAQADVNLMGNITNAKACYIEVTEGGGDLKVNAAAEVLPLSVDGGFWVWFNPNGGLTALTITTAADAKLRIYAFA